MVNGPPTRSKRLLKYAPSNGVMTYLNDTTTERSPDACHRSPDSDSERERGENNAFVEYNEKHVLRSYGDRQTSTTIYAVAQYYTTECCECLVYGDDSERGLLIFRYLYKWHNRK